MLLVLVTNRIHRQHINEGRRNNHDDKKQHTNIEDTKRNQGTNSKDVECHLSAEEDEKSNH